MDHREISYFEKADSKKHIEFINSQNNCILCGTILEMKYHTLECLDEIREEAYCPHCSVKTRTKTHTMN